MCAQICHLFNLLSNLIALHIPMSLIVFTPWSHISFYKGKKKAVVPKRNILLALLFPSAPLFKSTVNHIVGLTL